MVRRDKEGAILAGELLYLGLRGEISKLEEIRDGVVGLLISQISDYSTIALHKRLLCVLPETGAGELLVALGMSLPPLKEAFVNEIRYQGEEFIESFGYTGLTHKLIENLDNISKDTMKLAHALREKGIEVDTSEIEGRGKEIVGAVLRELLENLYKKIPQGGEDDIRILKAFYEDMKQANNDGQIIADIQGIGNTIFS